MGNRRTFFERFFAAVTTFFLVLILITTVVADQEGGFVQYTSATPDGKHIFVMRSASDPVTPYPQSGMYRNDGSFVPLWTVDWNAFAFVPSGGEYLIRKGAWARWSGSYDDEALTFFSNGRPIKSYTTAELIEFPWLLPHSVSHYAWQPAWTPNETDNHAAITFFGVRYSNKSVSFDDDGQHVHMVTELGDRISFDVRTGDIVSRTRSRMATTIAMFACLLVGYFACRIFVPGKASTTPLIKPSNVLAGGLFTFSLVAIPTTAAYFFRTINPSDGDSYEYFIRIGFETLPRYVAALAGLERPEIAPSGSPLMIGFWLTCFATFTIADRLVVSVIERVRWVR